MSNFENMFDIFLLSSGYGIQLQIIRIWHSDTTEFLQSELLHQTGLGKACQVSGRPLRTVVFPFESAFLACTQASGFCR